MEKIIFCLHHGTALGWLIDPMAKSVTIFQQGLPQIYLSDPNNTVSLTVLSDLEQLNLSATDIFAWLKI
jgi:Uma2 family endonuclease